MPDSVKNAIAFVAKSFKPIIKTILIVTLVIVVISACAYYIIIEDGSYKDKGDSSSGSSSGSTGSSGGNSNSDSSNTGDTSEKISNEDNVRYVLEEFINTITIESIVNNNNGGYAYATELNDKINNMFTKYPRVHSKIISYINEKELDSKKNIQEQKEEKAKELIKKFVKAEIIGKYPDLRSKEEIYGDYEVEENELQGGIKVVRRKSETEGEDTNSTQLTYEISEKDQILTYIPYELFTSKLVNNNEKSDIVDYFSLKPSGADTTSVDIVVARETKITTEKEHKTIKTSTTDTTVTEDGVVISTSETTNGPHENTEKSEPVVTYSYNEININYQSSLAKYSMPAGFLWSLLVGGEDTKFVEQLADLAIKNTDIVIEAQDNVTITVDTNILRYTEKSIDTGSYSEPISYTVEVEQEQEDGTTKKVETTITVTRTTSWITTTNIENIITTIEKTEESNTRLNLAYAETWLATYKRLYQNNILNEQINNDWENEAEWKDLTTEQIQIDTSEGTDEVNDIKTTSNSQTISYNEYTFAGTQVQDRHDIPEYEYDNFITYFNESGRAKIYILETTSWLYEMLESHEKTVDMVDIVKYLLSEATGTNYGVTSYNFLEYDFDDFNSSGVKGRERFVRYIQTDSKWASKEYKYKTAGGTIGAGGCGACALAMAVTGLTGTAVTPDVIVEYLNEKGIDTVNGGGGEKCAKAVKDKYDLYYTCIEISYGETIAPNGEKAEEINKALDAGMCLVFSVGYNGIYTGEGHYILCYGRDENGYYILDSSPKEYYTLDKPYKFEEVFTNLHQGIFVLGK